MPGRLLLACVLLESFPNFRPDPYYEPTIVVHDTHLFSSMVPLTSLKCTALDIVALKRLHMLAI